MNARTPLFHVLGLITCCLVTACSNTMDFEEHRTFKGESWSMGEPLSFEFDILDTAQPYMLGLDIRYTNDFPWQDLFLFLNTTLPDGSRSRDTLHCLLFTPDGKPVGKGSRIKELETGYSLVRFPLPGHYTLQYIHGMREAQVHGIVSFGMSLKKNNPAKK